MTTIRDARFPGLLGLTSEPDGTMSIGLTRANGPAVWEWATSKPFFSPTADGGLEITGLTVFTPAGRVKAEFGDFVTLSVRGEFGVRRVGSPS